MWYGSRKGEVQCRKRSFYGIYCPEAIRVWFPSLYPRVAENKWIDKLIVYSRVAENNWID